MIKITNLEFKADDCCGEHKTAHYVRPDGVEIGVTQGDGIYGVALYFSGGGLMGRHANQTAEQVETFLNQ